MTLANLDYEFEYAVAFVIALYFQIASWHGHQIDSIVGEEVGYAVILAKLRAIGFMLVSAFLWLFMFEETIAFQSAVGLGILGPVQWVFYALFWFNLIVGITLTFYLLLPTERLPKAFQYFAQQRQREDVPQG